MIAVLKNGTTPSQIQHLVDWLKNMNLDVHISEGSEVTILGLVGDTSRVDIDLLVVPRDGIVKRAARRQDRAVKAAVVPAVHIAVLQRVEPAGIVCQLIGVQLVHMVALLVRRVVEHQRQPHGQQRRHRQHALGFCVFHDSRFPCRPSCRGRACPALHFPMGGILPLCRGPGMPGPYHLACIPKRPASKGRPFVCFTPVRFLPCHAQNATAHRW